MPQFDALKGLVDPGKKPGQNVLFLGVLPIIHISTNQFGFGLTEELLTFFPSRDFATAFFPDEVDKYIQIAKTREKYLIGGHVTGLTFHKEPPSEDGRIIVRVIQHVGK